MATPTITKARKNYPARPTKGHTAPKYGSEENPRITDTERDIIKSCFADIFLFGPTNNDPYTELGGKLGCSRQRAKQLYWVFIWQVKGHYFNMVARERVIKSKLALRVKKYTEFLENPETMYQILARADDEAEETIITREKRSVKC